MGKIFVFVGPSCSGKDTLFKAVSEDLKELKAIVLYTNRPKREKEIDGVTYNFVSLEKIREMEANNEIIEKREYNTVNGLWIYATACSSIDLDNYNYITINTLEGLKTLKDYFGDSVIPIYIKTSYETRLQRATKREKKQKNPNFEEMKRRFLADELDFCDKNIRELGINNFYLNENLDECILEIENTISNELAKEKKKVLT